MIGLVLEGVSCFFIPFTGNFFVLMLPICIICFGIALIDTALLPMLGFIVDKKYTAVYGSVYAIADISYCAGATSFSVAVKYVADLAFKQTRITKYSSSAYAFGPVVAGHLVENFGFTTLNVVVGVISLIYAPIIFYLKDMHKSAKTEPMQGPG